MSDFYGVPRRRIVGETAFWIIALLVVGALLTIIGLGWRYAIAGPSGKVEAREQILSGDNRIRAYNSFFDQCSSIQAIESALSASLDELSSADPANSDNIIRIQTNITGLRAQRARGVAEYNANAAKDYTDGQFRDLNLPYQITDPFVKGQQITCAA